MKMKKISFDSYLQRLIVNAVNYSDLKPIEVTYDKINLNITPKISFSKKAPLFQINIVSPIDNSDVHSKQNNKQIECSIYLQKINIEEELKSLNQDFNYLNSHTSALQTPDTIHLIKLGTDRLWRETTEYIHSLAASVEFPNSITCTEHIENQLLKGLSEGKINISTNIVNIEALIQECLDIEKTIEQNNLTRYINTDVVSLKNNPIAKYIKIRKDNSCIINTEVKNEEISLTTVAMDLVRCREIYFYQNTPVGDENGLA